MAFAKGFLHGTSIVAFMALTIAPSARAGEVLAAVAANFTGAANEIAAAFTEATGHTVIHSFGPTGQIYAQITQEAPFEVFLAADQARPERAEAEGYAVPGTRFTYGVGRVVLWSADDTLIDGTGAVLGSGDFTHIAIANPQTAPYGAAAVETMQGLGVFASLGDKIVQGMTITQTHQFVATGNAQLGFVALSQVLDDESGSRWMVPQDLYAPIRQDAVLLERGAENEAARAYLAFLKGPEARMIIEKFGYDTED
ncbi:molybdate transport system substrate-binding protein [Rhodovulum imhoffii]|uniref:Molybdate transport system substrate-binding protein n=1 Tax=Rhodovulum imhoffii TaxID=365340 RepID=A0A2T5BS00_9RHOB|nr:molybdate ABC transporter substrate-binding protein [Rhodovulum imhoffii]MBK5933146.1 molybdate ABC transporter substrate-binding protein [Rhodovulum imhoffii]PTN02086.1 molybdate transport system substrate-binding protein [Rhodovulum imhoffii]